MRLLERNDAGEFRLKEFVGEDVPRYAILSHTWGTEEVSFRDLKEGTAKNKLGYEKIRFCGDQAWRDGLQHFWVDTCCIDKQSSVELQGAINCMFRWYRDAAKCYVYLADVSKPACDADDKPHKLAWESSFRRSRWFTRGWTLQELIAPTSVKFFSQEGVHLGNKSSLEPLIHHVTGIPVEALRGSPLSNFSIPERMAWTEHRETTREEDKAYSLLGIFNVQMPLLYGEGREKALKRLLEEVNAAAGRNQWSRAYKRGYNVFASFRIVSAAIATAMLIHFRRACSTSTMHSGEMGRRDADPFEHTFSIQAAVMYTLSLVIYSAVGLANLMQGQRYWSDCGLVATLIAVFIGCFVGMERMLDALIVGGYASLVTAKLLACLIGLPETGALQQTLKGHKNLVSAVAFSPDGTIPTSASGDETVRLWDAKTGALQQTLKGYNSSVYTVVFSPDSMTLASASCDPALGRENRHAPANAQEP